MDEKQKRQLDEENEHGNWRYSTTQFWNAVVVLRTYALIAFHEEYFNSFSAFPAEGSIQHTLDLIECYLGRAIAEGWLGEDEE